MPYKMGGCGFMSASDRRFAAPWAAWTAILEDTARAEGLSSVEDLLEALPALRAELQRTRDGLAEATGNATMRAEPLEESVLVVHKQSKWMSRVRRHSYNRLLQTSDKKQAAMLRSQGGSGGGSWQSFPLTRASTLDNQRWRIATRRRLGMPVLTDPAAPCPCQNIGTTNGTRCTELVDPEGHHAASCMLGGLLVARHHRVTRRLAAWVARLCSCTPMLEQRVPEWDRPGDAELERAVLDIAAADDGQQLYFDTVVVSPVSSNDRHLASAARRDGYVVRKAERAKASRYPGDSLIPAAFEVGGRIGPQLLAWVRAQVADREPDERSVTMDEFYRSVGVALQGSLASQLLRAVGDRAPRPRRGHV